jgi:hypothetical protein
VADWLNALRLWRHSRNCGLGFGFGFEAGFETLVDFFELLPVPSSIRPPIP